MVLDPNNSHFGATGEVVLMFKISKPIFDCPGLINIPIFLTSYKDQPIIPTTTSKQNTSPPGNMHFPKLALALFATAALAAPTASPTDIEAAPPTPAVDEPVIIAIPHGQVVPIPQGCCWIKSARRSFLGCGKACDH
jgi:hypothetical protein